MPTLNPFALLVIYIALSGAPSSVHHVSMELTPFLRLEFQREPEDWWSKTDDLGNKTYWKQDKTRLLVKDASNEVHSTDLASSFSITGTEDWSKPVVLYSKTDHADRVATQPGEKRLSVNFESRDKKQTATIYFGALQ